jgi:glycosyltransferase involved in cell wall biosynthesis
MNGEEEMDKTITNRVAPLSPTGRLRELPYAALQLALRARAITPYGGDEEAACIEMGGNKTVLFKGDYERAVELSVRLQKEWSEPAGTICDLVAPSMLIKAHRLLAEWVAEMEGPKKNAVLMLKDTTGSGWWRMELPAKHMQAAGWHADVTSGQVSYEALLEYDTIFMQRTHNWDSYYVMEKLKRAGKRIIYDLDDDIFSIPRDNPAHRVISRDEQYAAVACMKLADVVTTTTEELARRIEQILSDGGTTDYDPEEGRVQVIPNALDPSDNWPDITKTGSPDKIRRIFWQGSATHQADWNLCIAAIERVMQERQNVHLVILGFLPPQVQQRANLDHWQGKVEYLGFNNPETYYQLIHHVRADCAIAPLVANPFNAAKSPIKFIEYSLMGVPTVASDCSPYADVIEHGKTGHLVNTVDEWHEAINWCLDKSSRRVEMVRAARKTVESQFDLRQAAMKWTGVLCKLAQTAEAPTES